MRYGVDKAETLCHTTTMKDDKLAVVSPFDVVARPQQRQGNPALQNALEAQGVTRKGVISELYRIASTGEKVTTEYRQGKEFRKTVTLDPDVQMKAIERLEKLLDRAEGSGGVTRTLTYRED